MQDIPQTIKNNFPCLPFVEGFALQGYLIAEEGIIEANKNDYQYWYIDGSLEVDSPSAWDEKRISNMVAMIKAYGVKPLYHGNFKVPLASDVDDLRAVALDYTKREIDLAARLSAPVIIHGGGIVEPRLVLKAKKRALEMYLESVITLLTYAESQGVTLYLENLSNYKNYRPFHYIFTHDEEFEYILSATGAKFFLDMGHANIGNDSPKGIFEKYHRQIVGMSFSNNNGQQDQHLSLAKGSLDYAKIVTSIGATGWKGIIAFETRDLSPVQSVEELTDIYHAVNHG